MCVCECLQRLKVVFCVSRFYASANSRSYTDTFHLMNEVRAHTHTHTHTTHTHTHTQADEATVLRNGQVQLVPSSDVVPGDIVELAGAVCVCVRMVVRFVRLCVFMCVCACLCAHVCVQVCVCVKLCGACLYAGVSICVLVCVCVGWGVGGEGAGSIVHAF
jgi:hypothetical protein